MPLACDLLDITRHQRSRISPPATPPRTPIAKSFSPGPVDEFFDYRFGRLPYRSWSSTSQELAEATPGVYFLGRLGTYKYYNMDQVVAQALTLYAKLAGVSRRELARAES